MPSNIYSDEGGDHEIKIAGDVFMVISVCRILWVLSIGARFSLN
ncbi:MAG: hypothetical protein ABI686_07505 [Acidobacteriota bacterium]